MRRGDETRGVSELSVRPQAAGKASCPPKRIHRGNAQLKLNRTPERSLHHFWKAKKKGGSDDPAGLGVAEAGSLPHVREH